MPLSFIKEDVQDKSVKTWNILIVDDEPDIHAITQLALKRFTFENGDLHFINAYSGEEAKQIVKDHKDIALIFLDVVMETDDAGLVFVKWFREEHKNTLTRVILRTGQPGQAPEEKVIMDYDINDYKQKTELDRKRLFTAVVSSLRGYRDLIEIESSRQYEHEFRIGLKKVIEATTHVMEEKNIKTFFEGLLPQVLSILRFEQKGALIKTVKAGGTIFSENDYEVITEVGTDLQRNLDDKLKSLLNMAIEIKESVFEDDIFVAYLPSESEQESLIYLKGVDIDFIKELDIQLLQMFCRSAGVAFDNLILNSQILKTQSEIINRLGNAVESRSKESGNHIRRMSAFSGILARQLQLSKLECEVLELATPMHDVGKIATPDNILLKPAKLDENEFEIMKRHAEQGFEILSGSSLPIIKAASIIAHQHHEKFDGSGYPHGLKGEEIHIFARIVAVADVFDALLHKRCYKPAWQVDDVLKLIRDQKGAHFDPAIVDAMFECIDELIEANSQLTDEEGT
jgi:response regulator RpfG family c-di-GMP phosphodiesterase